MRRRAGIAALLAAAVVLAGCSANDELADQYSAGDSKGYIAGDGSVTEIPEDERGESIDFAGVDEYGDPVDSDELRGEVVVVNFWYAACAPCRAEAPILAGLDAEYGGNGAAFVGVNVYDQPDTALSFNRTYDIEYPSIMDVDDGAARLAFTGSVPPQAVPTTLVLDADGRVAARILGQIADESILDALIRDTIAE